MGYNPHVCIACSDCIDNGWGRDTYDIDDLTKHERKCALEGVLRDCWGSELTDLAFRVTWEVYVDSCRGYEDHAVNPDLLGRTSDDFLGLYNRYYAAVSQPLVAFTEEDDVTDLTPYEFVRAFKKCWKYVMKATWNSYTFTYCWRCSRRRSAE